MWNMECALDYVFAMFGTRLMSCVDKLYVGLAVNVSDQTLSFEINFSSCIRTFSKTKRHIVKELPIRSIVYV